MPAIPGCGRITSVTSRGHWEVLSLSPPAQERRAHSTCGKLVLTKEQERLAVESREQHNEQV